MAKYKKRKDGRYAFQVNLGTRDDGTYKRKTVYGRTVAELEEKIREAKNRHEQGFDLTANKPTVKAWADRWLEVYKSGIGRSTRAEYKTHINNRLTPIHNLKIDKVKPIQLQEILQATAASGVSQQTVNKLYYCITGVFESAYNNGLTVTDLTRSLAKPTGGRKDKRDALTSAERDKLISVCTKHEFGLPPLIMLYAGLRLGEVLALTYGDVKGDHINVDKTVVYQKNSNSPSIKNNPKTEAGIRKIPIAPPLRVAIDAYIRKCDQDGVKRLDSALLFPMSSGEPYSQTAWRYRWNRIMAAYNNAWQEENIFATLIAQNLPNFMDYNDVEKIMTQLRFNALVVAEPRSLTAHMLRHTFITSLYEANIDVKTAQRWAGHSTVSVLMDIYTHLSNEKEKESAEKLKSFFASKERHA